MAAGQVIAVVPARGGSKGIPRKNLVPIAGRSLVAWAVAAGLDAATVQRVVVSTDDDEIATEATAVGAEVLRRPAALGGDATPMLSVVQHAVDELFAGTEGVVVLLQPTSPLRQAHHVDRCVRALLDSDADAAVTIVRVPHQFAPGSLLEREGDVVRALVPEAATARRRQDKPTLFARNGPAVIATHSTVVRSGSLYGDTTVGVEMTKLESVDIDDIDDLRLVEALLRDSAQHG